MYRSILKLKKIREHSKDPLELEWQTWDKPLRGAGVAPATVCDDLREYSEEQSCRFAEVLPRRSLGPRAAWVPFPHWTDVLPPVAHSFFERTTNTTNQKRQQQR